MSNDHIKSEISLYLAGGLAESRNRQIEAHAAACEKCRGALAKARAKQARGKREALKKASPDPLPNLFLARQGKDAGYHRAPKRSPWRMGILILSIGTGAWAVKHYLLSSRIESPASPVPKPVVVPASSAPAPSIAATPTPPPAVSTSPVVSPAAPPKPPAIIPVQQEWRGPECAIKEARVVVIRNKESWEKIWAEMHVPEPVPVINFDEHVALAVFAGEKPGGSSISMGTILDLDIGVFATYHMTMARVQASSATVQAVPALSHPYLIALLSRVEKKIRLTPEEAPR